MPSTYDGLEPEHLTAVRLSCLSILLSDFSSSL
jgi:hypothetical protein